MNDNEIYLRDAAPGSICKITYHPTNYFNGRIILVCRNVVNSTLQKPIFIVISRPKNDSSSKGFYAMNIDGNGNIWSSSSPTFKEAKAIVVGKLDLIEV